MIKNGKQLNEANKKLKDIAELIVKHHDEKETMPYIPFIFNAIIGGLIKRMNVIYEDINKYLLKTP